jgi:hypothetical protein
MADQGLSQENHVDADVRELGWFEHPARHVTTAASSLIRTLATPQVISFFPPAQSSLLPTRFTGVVATFDTNGDFHVRDIHRIQVLPTNAPRILVDGQVHGHGNAVIGWVSRGHSPSTADHIGHFRRAADLKIAFTSGGELTLLDLGFLPRRFGID